MYIICSSFNVVILIIITTWSSVTGWATIRTQLIGSTSLSSIIDRRQRCASATDNWCACGRLQLNQLKTELIWIVPRVIFRKIAANDLSLPVGSDVITTTDVVRDLDVMFNSDLTMQRHPIEVAGVCSSSYSTS